MATDAAAISATAARTTPLSAGESTKLEALWRRHLLQRRSPRGYYPLGVWPMPVHLIVDAVDVSAGVSEVCS